MTEAAELEAAALREELALTQSYIEDLQKAQAESLLDNLCSAQDQQPPPEEALVDLDEDDSPSDIEGLALHAGSPLVMAVLQLLEWIKSDDEDTCAEALEALSDMVGHAYGGDGLIIGEVMRQKGGLLALVDLLTSGAPDDMCQQALLLLGNLCSDAVDAKSRLSKRALLQANAAAVIFLQLASQDEVTLTMACGAVQNLALDVAWAELAMKSAVDQLLGTLVAHPNELVVRERNASSCTRAFPSLLLPLICFFSLFRPRLP